MRRIVLSGLLVLSSAPVFAAPELSSLQGSFFTDTYLPTKQEPADSHVLQESVSGRIEGTPTLDENFSGHFDLSGDYLPISPEGGVETKLRVLEGYVKYKSSNWEIRAGEQIIPWGKSDVVNPTDFLSVKDFTIFRTDEELKRLGTPALLASWAGSNWKFTAVWSVLYPESRVLISTALLPSYVDVMDAPGRSVSFMNSEFAGKAAYAGDGWDFDLIAFDGYDHLPEYREFSESFSPIALSVIPQFRKIDGFGGNVSFNIPGLDRWTFRGESAITIPTDSSVSDPLQDSTHIDAVAGGERAIGDDFRAQLQAIWRYYPSHDFQSSTGDPFLDQIRFANQAVHAERVQSRIGGSLRFAYDPADHVGILPGLSADIFVLAYADGGDFLIQPKINYAWTDQFKLSAGVQDFGGSATNPLGSLSEFSAVFAEAKYIF
jgi:hypothetical protein